MRSLNFYSYCSDWWYCVRCIKLNSLHFNLNWHMTSGQPAFENVSFIAMDCVFAAVNRWKSLRNEKLGLASRKLASYIALRTDRTERNGMVEWTQVETSAFWNSRCQFVYMCVCGCVCELSIILFGISVFLVVLFMAKAYCFVCDVI